MSAGAIAPIIGGFIQSRSADRATRAQVDAANASRAQDRELFDLNRADLAPWREAGVFGLTQLRQGLEGDGLFTRTFQGQQPGAAPSAPKPEDIAKDPAYQNRIREGMKALEGGAASRGGLLSGGTLKGITRWAQGEASNEFERVDQRYRRDLQEHDRQWDLYNQAFNRFGVESDRRYNRLAGLAQTGQTTNAQLQRAGEVFGAANRESNDAIGNARSQGAIQQGNAWNTAIAGVGNFFQRNGGSGS